VRIAAKYHDQLRDTQVEEHDPKNQGNPRILMKGFGEIDPELGQRYDEHQQTNEEIFRRFRVFSRKYQKTQYQNEGDKHSGFDPWV
jgi:hypothetical protein